MPRTTLPPDDGRIRSRGLKGREEASERSIVSGNGYQGGITDVGKSVLLSGLPGKITTDAVRWFLKNYKLMGGQGEVVKLDASVSLFLGSRSIHSSMPADRLPVQEYEGCVDCSDACPTFLGIRGI
jgi:hypothetical protein